MEGYKNDVYLEVGTRLLGGDSQYAKLRMEHSRYYEVRDSGYVFAFRGIGGRLLAGDLLENECLIGGAVPFGIHRGSNDSLRESMLVVNAESSDSLLWTKLQCSLYRLGKNLGQERRLIPDLNS